MISAARTIPLNGRSRHVPHVQEEYVEWRAIPKYTDGPLYSVYTPRLVLKYNQQGKMVVATFFFFFVAYTKSSIGATSCDNNH
tara:strand:+ start:56 stop:304 length:249 start_codon:yes stop_codon:yes gene_type:complete